ncbi:MAG TPA: fused MFS/spermidine synthase, partial [Burkholderiaceae bacterium]|nr:fused MFS/spermidine synthase [Burkholderiaceae bacterium]
MKPRLALLLMVASGFAGLGYQIVWTQQSMLWLGHESAAVLAVVAAFFGGLALGALALAPRIARSARPARWYAACETVIGLWSVVLAWSLAPVSGWLLELTGVQPSAAWQWSLAFCGTFALLLPATAAMGATLPAMERVLAPLARGGTSIAALYAGNTFGAVLGVLAAAFWLVPELGLVRTAGVCAALNLLCAVVAWQVFGHPVQPAVRDADATTVVARSGRVGALTTLAATGLLGIGYEVVVVRVLSQVAENTVYTYAMLLAVYLVGSALGAAAYRRWAAQADRSATAGSDRLLHALAGACVLGTVALWAAPDLKAAASQAFGTTLGAALATEAALAAAAFLLPTVLMGALFSHLCIAAGARGIGFGQALGVNTLGGAAAPLLCGVLLIPAIGPKLALTLIAGGYLLLATRRSWSAPTWFVGAAAALALALWAPPLAFVDVPAGGRIVSYRDGATAAVSVVEDAGGVARLRIDNRQQEGSSATRYTDARQALLPLLLHPNPRRALFLGLGTGVTAASAAEDAQLQVDAVELLPEVIAASAYFRRAIDDGNGTANPRLHVMAADARRYVRTAGERYDLIVSDNFHPARSGSGALYTVEHFRAVRSRLAADGVFCQWLPLHQLDLATLRSIVRAFVSVYPNASALLATNSLETPVLGLVARADGGSRFDVPRLRERIASAALPHSPASFGLDDELALLGSFVAGPGALTRFAGDAPLNTDDRPVVAYRAPRITYVADSQPGDRLVALLREWRVEPDEIAGPAPDAAWAARLAAYWAARNRFVEVGRGVQPSADVRRMLAQVQQPLLAVLHISPDFRPAYDPLLRMASALAPHDSAGARALLLELMGVQPTRP